VFGHPLGWKGFRKKKSEAGTREALMATDSGSGKKEGLGRLVPLFKGLGERASEIKKKLTKEDYWETLWGMLKTEKRGYHIEKKRDGGGLLAVTVIQGIENLRRIKKVLEGRGLSRYYEKGEGWGNTQVLTSHGGLKELIAVSVRFGGRNERKTTRRKGTGYKPYKTNPACGGIEKYNTTQNGV